jgi:hypothetical protein
VSRNSLDLGWAVGQLNRSLLALGELARSYSVTICYYEDFRSLEAGRVAQALSWAGSSAAVSPEALRRVADRDAQEGSIVSRVSLRDVPDDLAFRDAFRAEWSRSRPRELIDRLGLRFL